MGVFFKYHILKSNESFISKDDNIFNDVKWLHIKIGRLIKCPKSFVQIVAFQCYQFKHSCTFVNRTAFKQHNPFKID